MDNKGFKVVDKSSNEGVLIFLNRQRAESYCCARGNLAIQEVELTQYKEGKWKNINEADRTPILG